MRKKIGKQKLWFFLTVLIFLVSCSDEPVSPEKKGFIKGQVLDAETGKGIPTVNITTAPPSVSVASDSSGNYQILDLDISNYTVTASKKDYNKASISVSVKESDTTTANIWLVKEKKANNPPNLPQNLFPANESTNRSIDPTLSWSASDPDGDSLTFDLIFYKANSTPAILVSDTKDSSYKVSQLKYNSTYYWQIKAKDKAGATTNGDTWSFTTLPFPDNPIVFARENNGNIDIYSAASDSANKQIVQLVDLNSVEWWPRLSPKREKIAFSSNKTIESNIFLINLDGTDLFQLTSIPIAGYHNNGIGFSWSPDGSQILYSHYEKLYRINIDRSQLTQIATAPANRHFREVEWSPLGDKIVALTIGSWFYDSEIYLMDSDGSNMTLLIDNWPGAIESPSFSPDGKQILFTYDVSGFEAPNNRQMDTRIFIMDIARLDTLDASKNKPAGTNDLFPRFSPDGSKIIFNNAPNDGSSMGDIWTMSIDGSNRKKLIDKGTMPDWR